GTDVAVNPTYTHTTLTAGGYFQFYVRASCGSEFSPWNGPFNFASGCDPIMEFSQNFDTTSYNAGLPICWSKVQNGSSPSANSMAQIVNFSAYSPSNCVIIGSDNGANAGIMLASPALGNLSAGTHRLKLFIK